MPADEWACIRFKRELWATVVRPAIEKVAAIESLNGEAINADTKDGKVYCVELIFAAINGLKPEQLRALLRQ